MNRTAFQRIYFQMFFLAVLSLGNRAQEVNLRERLSDLSSRPRPFPARLFAPYVDVSLKPPFSLVNTIAITGVKYYTLAFVINSEKGGCQATWDGSIPMSQKYMLSEINALRAKGGDVIVSFGGQGSTELATACSDAVSLEGQYQSVISAYNLTHIDFDIEGPSLADDMSKDRRNKVIAALQKKNADRGHELNISYTLPVTPSGLTAEGIKILQNAVTNKVNIATVNIMAMDYGGAEIANKMAQTAIDAANKTFAQIQTIFFEKSADEVRTMIGVTPMIGTNDTKPEVFTLADAKILFDYAKTNNVGRLSMWSMTRDKQCPKTTSSASPSCSSISQEPFAFSSIFKEFTQ